MDRLESHKEWEKQKEEYNKKRMKYQEEKLKLEEELDKKIKECGTDQIKKLWGKYITKTMLDKMFDMIDVLTIGSAGLGMEKMMTPYHFKCIKCKETLVPDGIFTGSEEKKEFKEKENQFVFLKCGEKYELKEVK